MRTTTLDVRALQCLRVVRGLPRPHGPRASRSETGPTGPLTADFPPLPCSTQRSHRCAGVGRSPLQTIKATQLRSVRSLCGPRRRLAVQAASAVAPARARNVPPRARQQVLKQATADLDSKPADSKTDPARTEKNNCSLPAHNDTTVLTYLATETRIS